MKSRGISIAFALLITATAVTLLYSFKLKNSFAWDDAVFIIRADDQADIRNIPGFFVTDQHLLYRPIRSTVYTLVRHFYGLRPVPYHLAGIFFHVAVTLLFLMIVYQISGSARLAMFAALFAGLHPVHCDRAANITGSFDLLGMMFGYASLPLFIQWLKRGTPAFLAGSMVMLSLGLLSSEEVATVPLLMILFFWAIPKEQAGSRNRFAKAIIPAFVLLFAYLALRVQFVHQFARVETHLAGGLYETILTMSVVFWRYIGYALFPFGLSAEHSTTIYEHLGPSPAFAFVGLVTLVAAAFLLKKKAPLFFIAVGWFFIGLAPFSNLIPLQTLMAERYFFAGLFGVAILYGWFFDRMTKAENPKIRIVSLVCVFLILGLYFFLSVQRIHTWYDRNTLWADVMKKDPNTYMGNLNWGNILCEKGDNKNSMLHWERANKIKPNGHEIYIAFGNRQVELNHPDKALEFYKTALNVRPGHLPAQEGIMQAKLLLGEHIEAIRLAMQIMETNPNNLVSLSVVSYILASRGHCDKAIPFLERLIANAPSGKLKEAAKLNLAKCK